MNNQETRAEETGVRAAVAGGSAPRTCNVLVVDDEKVVRMSLSIILMRPGHKVDSADDGDTALEKIRGAPGHYQVIVTDHAMKKMDGLELVRQLGETGFAGKIIVVTGCLGRDDEEKYRSLGVRGILYKPVDPVELRSAVRELLD